MILLSNTTAQTLQPGQAITFDDIILHSGNGECHKRNTSAVKLSTNGVYEVSFTGNIASLTAATPVQLAVFLGGAELTESTMISTPATANSFNNVSALTAVKNCCCDYDRITVVNSGTVPVTVAANSALFIKRISQGGFNNVSFN